MPQDKDSYQITPEDLPSAYEPPRVEIVLTAKDLELEFQQGAPAPVSPIP